MNFTVTRNFLNTSSCTRFILSFLNLFKWVKFRKCFPPAALRSPFQQLWETEITNDHLTLNNIHVFRDTFL